MLFGMFCCGQIELAAGWGTTLSDLNDYLNVSYSGNETQLYVPSVLLRKTHTHTCEPIFDKPGLRGTNGR